MIINKIHPKERRRKYLTFHVGKNTVIQREKENQIFIRNKKKLRCNLNPK